MIYLRKNTNIKKYRLLFFVFIDEFLFYTKCLILFLIYDYIPQISFVLDIYKNIYLLIYLEIDKQNTGIFLVLDGLIIQILN